MSFDLGIDFGTSRILVYGKDKGIVLNELAVIAYDKETIEVKAVGNEAKILMGRTTGNIISSYLFENNIYKNKELVIAFLSYVIQKTTGKILLIHPKVCISLPGCVSKEDMKIFEESAFECGAREVVMLDRVMASAIGAKIDIRNTIGNIFVDIGAKLTDIAVISFGKIIGRQIVEKGDVSFENKISDYIRKTYGIIIGKGYAEYLKNECGCVYSLSCNKEILVKGRSAVDGLLCERIVLSKEIEQCMAEEVDYISYAVLKLIDSIDDEMKKQIIQRGIILTGRGSLLKGFETLMEKKTNIQTMLGDNPDIASVTGTGIVLEFLDGSDGV